MAYPLALLVVLTLSAGPANLPARADAAGRFLVFSQGLTWLGPDGRNLERLTPSASNGAVSPDGRWLAAIELEPGAPKGTLVIRPRGHAAEPTAMSLLFGRPGASGVLPVWAPDSRRLLVVEHRGTGPGLEARHRL